MNRHAAFKPRPKRRSGSVAVCIAVSALGVSLMAGAGAKVPTFASARSTTVPAIRANGDGSVAATAPAKNGYKTLYSFTDGTDGGEPFDTVLRDNKTGNLYGTTLIGGAHGKGTIFRLTPDGTETVLYSFTGGSDGEEPQSFPHLFMDKKGNLYGTASTGGASGLGTVFELTSDLTLKTLYAFAGGVDGASPYSGLIVDKHGNFFGTTGAGGGTGCGGAGCGTVFELSRPTKKGHSWTETVLHPFGTGTDGQVPEDGLLMDKNGNLFGTTMAGGTIGLGTVFEVTAGGSESVLHSFQDGLDGAEPYGYLIEDAAGNLYGTTTIGGSDTHGTVFELAPDGTETVLHTFAGGKTDGALPDGGLIMDANGNLFGTNESGGGKGCGGEGCGSVFELSPPKKKDNSWAEKILIFFPGMPGGGRPYEGVVSDGKGTLYGTTDSGGGPGCYAGYGCGTVYELNQ